MKPYNSKARKKGGWPRFNSETKRGYPESNTWNSMHERCNNFERKENVKNAAYLREKAIVCDEWFDYQCFAEWWHSVEYKQVGWCLDKDILSKGNKLYSPETCCFVPQEVNILFINNRINRGKYPLGVYQHPVNKNYVASLRQGDRSLSQHIGSYPTVELAFAAYKNAKEIFIRSKAVLWKAQLDPRVYEAMMGWKIEITD